MEVLVTGAAGRIGQHVVEDLSKQHHVIAASRHPERYRGVPNVTSYEMDITNSRQRQYIFRTKHIDAVVHLAALSAAECQKDEEAASLVNTEATRQLGKLSVEYGVGHFINCSTSSVYNQKTLEPTPEDRNIGPLTIYGQTKLAAEEALDDVAETAGRTSITSLRIFNVYGEGLDRSLIKDMMSGKPLKLFRSNFSRDYIHVDDVVRPINLVLESPALELGRNTAMNIGSGISLNNQYLIGIMAEHGWEPDYTTVDNEGSITPYTWADISRARRLIGFNPNPQIQIPCNFNALSPVNC